MTERPPGWALTLANKYLKEAPGDWPLVMVMALALEAERARCADVANECAAICADAVAKIEAGELYQDIPTARASEQCAELEALHHIARLIEGNE